MLPWGYQLGEMAPMITYHVAAVPEDGVFVLHVESVGVTQSVGVHDAEFMARDYISATLNVPVGAFDVEVCGAG